MLLEVQEVSVSLSLSCVCFYSSKSITVKLPLSPVSFVDRSGSREERGEERGRGGRRVVERRTEVEERWREGGGRHNVRKLED